MKCVMYAMGAGIGVNLLLDPVLILWLDMGVRGAALATFFSQFISLVCMVVLLSREPIKTPLRVGTARIGRRAVKKIVSVGLPQGLAEILAAVFLLAMNRIVVGVDPEAMTAFGLCARIDQVVLLSVAALSSAVLTMIGQNAGRDLFERVKSIQKTAVSVGVGLVLIQSAILFWAAPWIYSLLSGTDSVIDYAVSQTRIVTAFYSLSVCVFISHSFFLAVGRPGPAVTVQVVKMFGLSIPLTLGLVYLAGLGMYGVWLGIILGEFVGCLLSLGWSSQLLRRLMKATPATEAVRRRLSEGSETLLRPE